MRGGGLKQMAGIIELMTLVRLLDPALAAGPGVGMLGINGAGGVKIAIGLLRGGDLGDQLIKILF